MLQSVCVPCTCSLEDAPPAEGQAEEGCDGAGEGEGSRRGWGCAEPGLSGSRGKASSAVLRCSGLSLPPSGAGVVRRICCSLTALCPCSSRPVFLMGFGRCRAPGSCSPRLKARDPWGNVLILDMAHGRSTEVCRVHICTCPQLKSAGAARVLLYSKGVS